MRGTAEERLAKRQARVPRFRQVNGNWSAFRNIQPGTLAALRASLARSGMGMDKLLATLIKAANRHGCMP